MAITLENLLLISSLLIIVSIFVSKWARYGIPTVVLFIIVGMLAGKYGLGGIDFYDIQLSKFIGTIALILILFSGGLDTRWDDVRPVLRSGLLLSTLGVVITMLATAAFVHWAIDLPILQSCLLGAIVSSTDAASVFTTLRSKNMGLKNKIRPLLELESGSNDPMAYFLTILFIQLSMDPNLGAGDFILFFLGQFIIGGVAGIGFGWLILRIMNRIGLSFEGLYSVFLLALAFFTFSFADFIGGNGFLAVYLAGCILGNREFIHKRSLTKHFDGSAWLMQILMFLSLGMLANPSQLLELWLPGLGISLFIIFVARPMAVNITLYRSRFNMRARAFILVGGLRGAVPIVLSLYALNAKVPHAEVIFNLVFFISISSVLLQGMTMAGVSNLLHLSVPVLKRKKAKLDYELASKIKSIVVELEVPAGSPCINKAIINSKIPEGVLISMIKRNSAYLVPEGATTFQEGDILTVMTESVEILQDFNEKLGIKRG